MPKPSLRRSLLTHRNGSSQVYELKMCLFSHKNNFLQVLKTLPAVAQNLGKRVFKGQFLEEFLDCLFYALDSRDHALASAAASQCLEFLTEFIGPNILRGRVEQHNPRYLPLMDTNSMVNQGPMSPLGLGRGAVSTSPGSPFSSPPPPKTLAIPIEPRERTQSLGGTPTNSPRQ